MLRFVGGRVEAELVDEEVGIEDPEDLLAVVLNVRERIDGVAAGHAGPDVVRGQRDGFLPILLEQRSHVEEHAVGHVGGKVVVPAAGEGDVEVFAGLGGQVDLVSGHVLVLALNADLLAGDLVQLGLYLRPVDRGVAGSEEPPGQLHRFLGRRHAQRHEHHESQNDRKQFFHRGTSFNYSQTVSPAAGPCCRLSRGIRP